MKKYIFAAVLSLGILVSPTFTQAAGLAGPQIQAILAILSSFGADQSIINNVRAALYGTSSQPAITVLSPNGGETLTAGGTYTGSFSWNGFVPLGITVFLYRPTVDNSTIVLDKEAGISTLAAGNKSFSYTIPSTIQSGSDYRIRICAETTTPFTEQCDASDAPFSIVAGTTTSAPTVEFVGTPTLSLQYDSAGKEATLVGKVTVKITAGNVDMHFGGSVPVFLTNGQQQAYTNSTKITVTSSVGSTPPGTAPSVIPTIPANTTATITIDYSVPTTELFAGSYYLRPIDLWYYVNNYSGQTISTSSFINAYLSNTVTIIGETSPYITSAVSDASGNLVITGVRFAATGNLLTVGGSSIGTFPSLNNGTQITVPNYTGGATTLQVTSPSTGRSNIVYVIVNEKTPITLTSISPASGPVGTSIRLDGCGSDSSSGFTLYYKGPASGAIDSISMNMLGATSCGPVGYMTFTLPSNSPAGVYTLWVKNNQTGAMSTNSETFTVTTTTANSWSQASSGGQITQKLFFVSPTQMYGIGLDGSIWKWNGSTWTQVTRNGSIKDDFTLISENDIYAIGLDNQIWHWNGSAWSQASSGGQITQKLFFVSPTQMYGIGLDNKIWKWAGGSNWTQVTTSSQIKDDFTLVNNSESDIYAIGLDNQIWHWGSRAIGIKSGNFNPGLASVLGAFSGANRAMNPVSQRVDNESTNNFTYVWNRDLQIGSPYSDDITALQKALAKDGEYVGDLTGGFYNQTYAAVKAFQEKYGIDATGFVGPLTRSKLNSLY